MKRSNCLAVCAAVLTLAAHARAHIHINMTPAGSTQGSPLAISFYGNEVGDNVSIVDTGSRKELHYSGTNPDSFSIYTVTADLKVTNEYDSISPGFLSGLRRGRIFNFTSDGSGSDVLRDNPNTSTPPVYDRLTNGVGKPVGYEIVSVVNTLTNQPLASSFRVEWRLIRGPLGNNPANPLRLPDPFSGYPTFSGNSSGLTPEARSYLLRVGSHAHGSSLFPDSGFFLFTDAPLGLYDVTIRAWDVEGYFAASEPVTFRLNVVPEPASLGLIGVAGAMLLARRRR